MPVQGGLSVEAILELLVVHQEPLELEGADRTVKVDVVGPSWSAFRAGGSISPAGMFGFRTSRPAAASWFTNSLNSLSVRRPSLSVSKTLKRAVSKRMVALASEKEIHCDLLASAIEVRRWVSGGGR